jgi:hypothetical protein
MEKKHGGKRTFIRNKRRQKKKIVHQGNGMGFMYQLALSDVFVPLHCQLLQLP